MSTALPYTPATVAVNQGNNPNELRIARFDLLATRIVTSFTTPILLLPPVTGYCYTVINYIATKNAVTAYGNPQSASISYNNTALSGSGFLLDASFWSAATKITELGAAASANRIVSVIPEDATSFSGKGLVLNTLVGNMTGGSDITILLCYMIFPTVVENIGNY